MEKKSATNMEEKKTIIGLKSPCLKLSDKQAQNFKSRAFVTWQKLMMLYLCHRHKLH